MQAALRTFLPEGGTLDDDVWARRHRGVRILLWAHAVFIPVYAAARGYGLAHTVLESAIVPVSALAAGYAGFTRRARTLAASVGLLSSSAVLVHLSGGVIEMHFHFFVMVVVVSLYQDWMPFLGAIGYVLVHHGLFGALDPDSVFNHAAAVNQPWKWAGIHALFIAGISAASLVNWRLNETHTAHRLAAEEALAEEGRIIAKVNEVGRLLASDLELDRIVQKVTDHATAVTEAEFGAFFYNVSEGDSGDAYLLYTLSGAPPEAFAQFPNPRATAVFAPTFRGEGVIRSDDITADERYGREAPHYGMPSGHLPVRSYLAVPVVAGDEVIGGLFFGHSQVGRFSEAHERLVVGIAAHAALAVRNAHRFADQRAAAVTLQHSLMPERLPLVPGIRTAARYHAGGDGTEVGGDWYDVLELRSGMVGLVVGDVVGRGIGAAAIMGQLRNGLRAYALDGHPPADTMARLNQFARDTGLVGYVGTVLFAVYDLVSGTLSVASAGHLPLAVRHPDGRAELVGYRLGLPVGVSATAEYRQIDVHLEPGSTLALFTDGVVEDRTRPITDGLAHLTHLIEDTPRDAGQWCDHLLDVLSRNRNVEDDSAILVLQTDPLAADILLDVPMSPHALQPLRGVLQRWLTRAGVDEDECFDILVAVGEGASNAIRHAVDGGESFSVEGHVDGEVRVMVRNQGGWRPPREHSSGGRGLKIVEALMDDVELTVGPPETRLAMRRVLATKLSVPA